MEKIGAILGIAAATITLLTFFFRSWANLRRGRRMDAYRHDLHERSELELERLRQEIEKKP
ncbi:MAG TPA: hypothetical protein VGJ77_06980 [Gaiellaceae bacterium]